MAIGGPPGDLERLAAGRTIAAAVAVHAALVTWIEFSSPSTTAPGVLSAIAWAASEHPGRCALAATLAGWGLWKPHSRARAESLSTPANTSPSVNTPPSVHTGEGVDEPIEL